MGSKISMTTDRMENILTLSQMVEMAGVSADSDNDISAFAWTADNRQAEILPMRIDCLMISVCTGGHAHIGIDLTEYDLSKDCVVVLQPRNYIVKFAPEDDCTFTTIACSAKTIEEMLPRFSDILHLVIRHRLSPVIQLSEREATAMRNFADFIGDKIAEAPTPFRIPKLRCALQTALYELLDIHASRCDEGPALFSSRREELMAQFIQAVSQHFREERQVSYYADLLCVSPKHLTFVVKSVSGMTPGRWIDTYVVMEAKILLRNTALSIQQITSRLNFANQSFFGKYFKKIAGLSPSDYRKSLTSTR